MSVVERFVNRYLEKRGRRVTATGVEHAEFTQEEIPPGRRCKILFGCVAIDQWGNESLVTAHMNLGWQVLVSEDRRWMADFIATCKADPESIFVTEPGPRMEIRVYEQTEVAEVLREGL